MKDWWYVKFCQFIELSDLLQGFDPLTSAIKDFVRFTEIGTKSYLSVDTDGAGSVANFIQIARMDNITGITDEQALFNAGQLLIA